MAAQDSPRSFAVMTRRDMERLHKRVGEAHRLFSADTLDFGPSVQGRHPDDDPKRFTGRRVDAMARSVSDHIEDREAAVRAWLASGSTSARLLSTRPVILVGPKRILSQVVTMP